MVQITESYMCFTVLLTGTLNVVGVGVMGAVGGGLGVGVFTTRFSIYRKDGDCVLQVEKSKHAQREKIGKGD